MNIEKEDPRINLFLRTVGSPECRAKLLDFQRKLLARESEILPLLKRFKEQNNIVFPQSDGLIYEFAVLEVPIHFLVDSPAIDSQTC